MFEFHGWATIRVRDADKPVFDGFRSSIRSAEDRAIKQIRAAINEVHDECSVFEIRRSQNGLIVLIVHGLRDSHLSGVIELFWWLGRTLPNSYGLLHVRDDEREGHEHQFRVWRLANGKLAEYVDPFLSLRVPAIEEPPVPNLDSPKENTNHINKQPR